MGTDILKPTLVLDFDGVLHLYSSGWHGPRVVADGPVPGALEFLARATEYFSVAIVSSRSHRWGARRAMRRWLLRQYIEAGRVYKHCPDWLRQRVCEIAFADPWEDDVRYVARSIVGSIAFPRHKPAAFLTIDDRSLRFTGRWSDFPLDELAAFKPWNKR